MNILVFLHLIISVFLVATILLQAGESGMFAGGGLMRGGENFHTRRGLEKVLFSLTFVWVALFAILSILILR